MMSTDPNAILAISTSTICHITEQYGHTVLRYATMSSSSSESEDFGSDVDSDSETSSETDLSTRISQNDKSLTEVEIRDIDILEWNQEREGVMR